MDNKWDISIEKTLTSIQKDVEYIKTNMASKLSSEINRWLIGGLFAGMLTLGISMMQIYASLKK
jgi:tetrahydromethanopterin S-methyltransferase subunit G